MCLRLFYRTVGWRHRIWCSCHFTLPTSSCRRLHVTSKMTDKDDRKQQRYLGRIYGIPVRITSEEEARELLGLLKKPERALLLKVLSEHMTPEQKEDIMEQEKQGALGASMTLIPALTREQARSLFLVNALPFVGFGFLDNFIMIVAGEYIDMKMGVMFGISTMAAAGLGNTISDVFGVGLAHYVELVVGKLGIRAPPLTPEQWESGRARMMVNLGRAFGIIAGCILGMCPLLFFQSDKEEDDDDDEDKK